MADAVEEARQKALADEQERDRLARERTAEQERRGVVGGQEYDPATGHDIHHPGDVTDRHLTETERLNRPPYGTGIPPGIPGSPGQPTDPPILTGDPAWSPLAADSKEAAEHLASRRRMVAGEVDGETKFALDSQGRRVEEVGTVIDRSVPEEDLAETNEARAQERAKAEENNARLQREAEERQAKANEEAKAQHDQAEAQARDAADKQNKKP